MATSQNGYTVHVNQSRLAILSWVTGRVLPGDVHAAFDHLCRRYHAEVEPITRAHSWGWAYRPIRGQTSGYSNHASGTAIDLNAPKHPLGSRGTFTTRQVRAIRRILDEFGGAIRWGGDYQRRADEMHFEIDATPRRLAEVMRAIRAGDRPTPGPPTTGVDDTPKPTPDTRTPIERLLDTMDEKTLRNIIRTEARAALYAPLTDNKIGDGAVDGSINNAIWHAARTVDTVALVREGVRQELWGALIPDHDGIPGSSIRNNLLHQTNASVSTLALVRQLAQREGVDIDEAAIVQGLTEALAPVIRQLVAEEAGDEIADRVVSRIGARLTED